MRDDSILASTPEGYTSYDRCRTGTPSGVHTHRPSYIPRVCSATPGYHSDNPSGVCVSSVIYFSIYWRAMCSVSELRLIYSETTLKLQKYEKGNLEDDYPTGHLDPYGHRHHPRRHQLHERLKTAINVARAFARHDKRKHFPVSYCSLFVFALLTN